MRTECSGRPVELQDRGRRRVTVDFNGYVLVPRHGDVGDHDRFRDGSLPAPAVGRSDIPGLGRSHAASRLHAVGVHRRFSDGGIGMIRGNRSGALRILA